MRRGMHCTRVVRVSSQEGELISSEFYCILCCCGMRVRHNARLVLVRKTPSRLMWTGHAVYTAQHATGLPDVQSDIPNCR